MRVGIYTRLSDEDRNKESPLLDSESIQNQKTMLLNYALQQGWEISKIYSDDDYSGSDRNRPEFNHMLSDAEAGHFDILLCKTQSRFSRELELVEKYLHGLFPLWGVRFVSIVDNADTAVKGNKKSRQINGLVNEWYLEDLSENVRSVLNAKRKQGQHIGSFALYGYQKDPHKKNHLIPDPEAAQVVRMVFQWYLEGNGATKIANMLNVQAIPNPSGYKRIKGENFHPAKISPRGDLWSYTTISAMLRNQMYAGDMVQGRTEKVSYKSDKERRTPRDRWFVVPDTHEPLIDRDNWLLVQARLDGHTKPTKSGTVHLFAGKVKCAKCGNALHSQHAKGIKYLRCPTADTSKAICTGCSIQLRQLEAYVLDELNRLCQLYFDEAELLQAVKLPDTLAEQDALICRQLAELEKRLATTGTALKNLYLDKLSGEITAALFAELTGQLTADKERLQAQRDCLEQQQEAVRQQQKQRQSKEEIIRKYRHLDNLNRPLVEEFIREIHIGDRDPVTKKPAIEIVWSF